MCQKLGYAVCLVAQSDVCCQSAVFDAAAAAAAGLVVAQDYKRGQQLVADRDFEQVG
jgi:hypothetical protein